MTWESRPPAQISPTRSARYADAQAAFLVAARWLADALRKLREEGAALAKIGTTSLGRCVLGGS
ncbi:MAG TPA: hypothetical protein VMV07_18585 [Streptosporangiaceae bacterium]|nr:hypothetical protein [Streptosporangiaceae bacterium]